MSTTHESETLANPAESTEATARVSGELADLPNRFIAAIIDGLIVGVGASIVSVPVVIGLSVPWFLSPLLFSVMAFGIFVAANYKLLESSGQTIGKKLLQLKIVNTDGSQPATKDLIVKRYALVWLVTGIPILGGLVALGNVLLGLRESRLAGHDELAGTRVVNA